MHSYMIFKQIYLTQTELVITQTLKLRSLDAPLDGEYIFTFYFK